MTEKSLPPKELKAIKEIKDLHVNLLKILNLVYPTPQKNEKPRFRDFSFSIEYDNGYTSPC